jgi:hypothetical protein
MKEWFFFSHGKVSPALNYSEAKTFLSNNPDAYGWNATFKQWKPVSCINEFVEFIPNAVPRPLIAKETSERFRSKKMSIESKLATSEDILKHSFKSLTEFKKQVKDYKALTFRLNDNVKGTIESIEKKCDVLSSKLTNLKRNLDMTKIEMSEVVEGFNRKIQANDILMPTCLPSSKVHYLPKSQVKNLSVYKEKLATEKLLTPVKNPNNSKLATINTPKVTSPAKKAEQNTKSSYTVKRVYRGVQYKVEKHI